MLPQVEVEQNGSTGEKSYNEGMVEAYEQTWRWQDRQDQKVRDNPDVRLQMTLLIPALGDLLHDHARQLGERVNQDCPFQVDDHAETLVWMLVEYLTRSEFDQGAREDNTRAHQLSASYAQWFFDWPPSPEEA